MKPASRTQSFSASLRELRIRNSWGQGELARRVGVSLGSVKNWEAQHNIPQPRLLQKLADAFGVPIPFLLGGSSAMTPQRPRNQSREPMPLKEFMACRIPVMGWAAAGHGGKFGQLTGPVDEWINADSPEPGSYALIIEDDSMSPYFLPGDRAVFFPNAKPQNGDVVVAQLAESGEVFFKMFHLDEARGETVWLTSYNPVYPALEFPRKAFTFIHSTYEMRRRR